MNGVDGDASCVDAAGDACLLGYGLMGGVPTLRGLRIPVATVVAMVADGMTTDEILADLRDLEPEDVAEALRYAAEAVRERHLPLRPPA
jgi:uncharacterized protein (DUF433 family)